MTDTLKLMNRGTLASALIALRQGAGLSQRGLAETSQVSQGTIRDIETGKQRKPRWDTLRMLAEGLSLAPTGAPDERLTGAAYRTLLFAAGDGDQLKAESPSAPSDVDAHLRFLLSEGVGGRPLEEETADEIARLWKLVLVLDRIQQGLMLADESSQAMILDILTAIAERLLPGGVLPVVADDLRHRFPHAFRAVNARYRDQGSEG